MEDYMSFFGAQNFLLEVSKGNVANHAIINKFGDAPDFDTGDNEVTIWDGADDANIDQMVYQYSSSADIDSVSSSSGSDTSTLRILGLDTNYAEVNQTVTLSGQTRVALGTSLIRVYRMIYEDGTSNVGHIYCYVNGAITGGVPNDSTTVRAVIQPTLGQTLMSLYTVPAGKTAYLTGFYGSTAGANRSTNYKILLCARPDTLSFQVKHLTAISDDGSSHFNHIYNIYPSFAAKTDIEMRAQITAAAITGGSVSSGFDLILVDN
jgi:hypothetical protein